MPITSSARKALRRDKRREKQNLRVKKSFRSAIKAFEKKPTKKNLETAYSEIDKAAKKNVIHKNKASRLKSKLTKRLKK
jgi:small subunit ribosomal protein S20